jgi:apolipoprotein N-acyltransferase
MRPLRLPRWLAPTLLMLGAGLAQAVSVAAPWNGQPLWWLQLLSLALLGWQLHRCAEREGSWRSSTWTDERPRTVWRRAAWLTWVFALAWLIGSFWWLFISMHTYGGLPAPLAVLAVLALAGLLAFYYAAACAVFVRFFGATCLAGGARAAIVFAALWTLAELVRARWLTGFPWGAGGYAHTGGPLAGYAPWIGVHGVGAVAAWIGLTLPQLARAGWVQRAAVLAVLALPAAAQWGGLTFSQPAGRQAVALLQGNIPQDEKFQPGTGMADALRWYGEQLLAARAPLVVAPETALPMLPQQLPAGYWDALRARFGREGPGGGQAALIGVPLGSYAEGYTNSVVGLKPGQGEPYRYDKHHLVPFGEFIPWGFRWFTQMMAIPLGDFNRGSVGQGSLDWQGQRLAPNICYEDLFGEELGARFADPARAPTAMVNVSNIAWFGNTVAIDQHLQISRMRALEFERPMLRATNTGATVIIDHRGQITHSLPRHTRGVLAGEFEGRTGLTPYARWVSRLGLWPLWGLALALVMTLALAGRLRRR